MTDLPEELRELENRISRLSMGSPSADFRSRLLGAVNTELAMRLSTPPARDSWYWITAAASILIVLNVSLISASRCEFSFGPSASPAPLTAELNALRTVENQMTGKYK
jgi:hypothetical protein